jgi:replicative DNA helicase
MTAGDRSASAIPVGARSEWDGPPASMTVDFANLPEQPSFPAAETAVLGAVMLSPTAAAKLMPILRTEHFTSRPHRDTLVAVRRLWERQQPIDPVLVHDQLRKDGHLMWGETKAALFIERCLEAAYFPGNGTSYATTVLEYAVRRRAVQVGVRIAQAAAGGRMELQDVMRLVADEVSGLANEVSTKDTLAAGAIAPTRIGPVIRELRDELEVKRAHSEPTRVEGQTRLSRQFASPGEHEDGFHI